MYDIAKNTHGGLSIGNPAPRVSLVKQLSGTHVIRFRDLMTGGLYWRYRDSRTQAERFALTVTRAPGWELLSLYTI